MHNNGRRPSEQILAYQPGRHARTFSGHIRQRKVPGEDGLRQMRRGRAAGEHHRGHIVQVQRPGHHADTGAQRGESPSGAIRAQDRALCCLFHLHPPQEEPGRSDGSYSFRLDNQGRRHVSEGIVGRIGLCLGQSGPDDPGRETVQPRHGVRLHSGCRRTRGMQQERARKGEDIHREAGQRDCRSVL